MKSSSLQNIRIVSNLKVIDFMVKNSLHEKLGSSEIIQLIFDHFLQNINTL